MRPVQQLYYDHGELYCPVHGHAYIHFLTDDGPKRTLYWCCAAILPDGEHCLHSAEWESLEDIEDADVRQLTASAQRHLAAG